MTHPLHPRRRAVLRLGAATAVAALTASALHAQDQTLPKGLRFASIDGGYLELDDWAGQPILLVNTASRCGFTPQYAALQALHTRYGPQGLVVLAVPSDDFRQELSSAEAVKTFCEVTFGLTLPMTDITPVRGRKAHPLYRWLRQAHGITPRWNFHKVLLSGAGRPLGTWDPSVRPVAPSLRSAIEASLAAAS